MYFVDSKATIPPQVEKSLGPDFMREAQHKFSFLRFLALSVLEPIPLSHLKRMKMEWLSPPQKFRLLEAWCWVAAFYTHSRIDRWKWVKRKFVSRSFHPLCQRRPETCLSAWDDSLVKRLCPRDSDGLLRKTNHLDYDDLELFFFEIREDLRAAMAQKFGVPTRRSFWRAITLRNPNIPPMDETLRKAGILKNANGNYVYDHAAFLNPLIILKTMSHWALGEQAPFILKWQKQWEIILMLFLHFSLFPLSMGRWFLEAIRCHCLLDPSMFLRQSGHATYLWLEWAGPS